MVIYWIFHDKDQIYILSLNLHRRELIKSNNKFILISDNLQYLLIFNYKLIISFIKTAINGISLILVA